MYEVMKSFISRGCSNPVINTCRSSVDIGASANWRWWISFAAYVIC